VALKRTAIASAREGGGGGGLGMSSPPCEGSAPSDPCVCIGICYKNYIYSLPHGTHNLEKYFTYFNFFIIQQFSTLETNEYNFSNLRKNIILQTRPNYGRLGTL
jgi:hypothetical protein